MLIIHKTQMSVYGIARVHRSLDFVSVPMHHVTFIVMYATSANVLTTHSFCLDTVAFNKVSY